MINATGEANFTAIYKKYLIPNRNLLINLNNFYEKNITTTSINVCVMFVMVFISFIFTYNVIASFKILLYLILSFSILGWSYDFEDVFAYYADRGTNPIEVVL